MAYDNILLFLLPLATIYYIFSIFVYRCLGLLLCYTSHFNKSRVSILDSRKSVCADKKQNVCYKSYDFGVKKSFSGINFIFREYKYTWCLGVCFSCMRIMYIFFRTFLFIFFRNVVIYFANDNKKRLK